MAADNDWNSGKLSSQPRVRHQRRPVKSELLYVKRKTQQKVVRRVCLQPNKKLGHGMATRWGKLQDLFYFTFKMTNLTMKYIHDDKAVCSSMHLMTPDSQQYIIREAVWILITNTWTSRHVSVNLLYRTARQTLHMVWAEHSEAPRFYSSAI
jgi:hypothetical protein